MDQAAQEARQYKLAPVARMFRTGYGELKAGSEGAGSGLAAHSTQVDRVQRALRRSASVEIGALEACAKACSAPSQTA